MNFADGQSVDQFKDLRAQVTAAQQQYQVILERYQEFKTNFGVKERRDGSITIDYDKFVERLGKEGWAELRRIGDEKHGAGAAGEAMGLKPGDMIKSPDGSYGEFVGYAQDGKPRFKVKAKAAA